MVLLNTADLAIYVSYTSNDRERITFYGKILLIHLWMALTLLLLLLMWHIYMMDYYSAIKSNEIMPFAAIWMDLESVIWSEVSQTEEKYHMTSLICGI